jgi:hypothetical protein
MNRLKVFAGLLTIFVASLSTGIGPASSSAQIREIPVRGLRGIAKVGKNKRGGHNIYYNPRTCRRLGPDLCSFFRAHEHAHVRLNHFGRGVPVRQAEWEADIWAAKNSSPASVRAAVRYFRRGNGGSIKHGSSISRARRVLGSSNTYSAQGRRRFFAPFTR